MFVADGIDEPREISSMPGVFQHTLDSARKAAAEAVSAGVGGLMLAPACRGDWYAPVTTPDPTGVDDHRTRPSTRC